jgi:hypothetical protein
MMAAWELLGLIGLLFLAFVVAPEVLLPSRWLEKLLAGPKRRYALYITDAKAAERIDRVCRATNCDVSDLFNAGFNIIEEALRQQDKGRERLVCAGPPNPEGLVEFRELEVDALERAKFRREVRP